MKTIKAEITTSNDVCLACPNCDMWECLDIDDARHHFQILGIDRWLPDEEDKPEISINYCSQCSKEFKVIWDYTKPDNK